MAEMRHTGPGSFHEFAVAEEEDRLVRVEREALTSEQTDWDAASRDLNDAAEMRVFGSRGNTYYDEDGEVMADAETILPSFADRVRANRSVTVLERRRGDDGELSETEEVELELSADPRERERLAQEYEADIRTFTEVTGLDLFQAEELAEEHLRNQVRLFDLANRLTAGEDGDRYDPTTGRREAGSAGMTPDRAVEHAENMYQRSEERRIREAVLLNPYTREAEVARRAPNAREQALIDASREEVTEEVTDEAAGIRDEREARARREAARLERTRRRTEGGEADDDDEDEPDDDEDDVARRGLLRALRDRLGRDGGADDDADAPERREHGHRRRWVAIGIGAVALAATTAALILETRTGVPVPKPKGAGGGAGGGTPDTDTYVSLAKGSNPWNAARDWLEAHGTKHPTDAQIEAEDTKIGQAYMAAHHLGPFSWSSWSSIATRLPAGIKLRVK